jgi:hypothetical protein
MSNTPITDRVDRDVYQSGPAHYFDMREHARALELMCAELAEAGTCVNECLAGAVYKCSWCEALASYEAMKKGGV